MVDVDQLTVVNNPEESRFEAWIGDQVAVLDYVIDHEGDLVLTHAGTPSALEGQGIAGKVTRDALEYAKANGLRVVPLCSYVSAYIRRHPEYRPLVK